MTELEAKKELLSPPGATILEMIENLKMSQTELGERLGKSKGKVSELIRGKTAITNETAHKLEMVLDVAAGFWLNLEKNYQEEIVEIEKLAHLENCQEWVSKFPLPFLKKHGILPKTRKKTELSEALLKFFQVASPNEWTSIYAERSMAFKIELKHTSHAEAISVWLRMGELKANELQSGKFDKKCTLNNIDAFKKICQNPSQNWMQDLMDLCAEHGIALALVPSIKKAPIYGVARWLKQNSQPVIQLTDRNRDYNSFWFSFYHELAHILKHGRTDIFLEGLESISQDNKKEKEADKFAEKQVQLSNETMERFSLDFKTLSQGEKRRSIKSIARKERLNESIVVSQLQRMKLISYSDPIVKEFKIKVGV